MAVEGQDQQSAVRRAMAEAQSRQGGTNKNEDRGGQQEERGSRREESRRGETQGHSRFASLSSIGRINPTPIAMSNTAEALETFRRDFVEAMPSKDDNNMLNTSVFPIDAATAGIPFSLLVVAGTRRGKEDLGVGYHTFVLAGSAETLRPREESFRGQRVFIVQVPGDGYNNRTREVIKDVLGRHYVGKNLFSADAEVISEGFPSAKEDPQAIADCVKNAFAAIKTAIDRNDPDAPQLQLTADDNADTYNSVHVQHRQNHIFDRGHMPTRADVIVDLQSRENKGRNSRDSIDQLVTGTRISRLGGFFDFVYAPAEGATNRNDLYSRRDRRVSGEEYQLYALRFVTTFVDTVDFSPTTMLLAMATMNAMGESQEVMRAFEPNQSLGEDDPRNIGALAIEPNLQDMERGFGERWETKTTAFTTAKRQALLRAAVRPGIIFSIDVPECGASTWQHIDLLAAAQGNEKAMRRIYDAACVLTNGHFEDLYGRDELIIDPHIERIHAGYYTEGNGSNQRLDLRDFDYLALLNYLRPEKEEDLEIIQRWGMAASSNDDTILTQSERYEIIKDFVPTAVITGYHQRFNFTLGFNEALLEAVNRCKLSLNPTSSGRDGNDRYRTTYGNIDQILNRPGSGGLYRNQRQGRDRYDDRYSD
ncbi:MAG TPA: hypothetical protein VF905_12985, partial [Nitrospirota bacterium]